MPLFERIYKLMKSNMARIPLEDYTTEILAGILEKDEALLCKFADEILRIPWSGL